MREMSDERKPIIMSRQQQHTRRLFLQMALSFQFLGRIDGQHHPVLQHDNPDKTANEVTWTLEYK